jgi:hypothetical protein
LLEFQSGDIAYLLAVELESSSSLTERLKRENSKYFVSPSERKQGDLFEQTFAIDGDLPNPLPEWKP